MRGATRRAAGESEAAASAARPQISEIDAVDWLPTPAPTTK